MQSNLQQHKHLQQRRRHLSSIAAPLAARCSPKQQLTMQHCAWDFAFAVDMLSPCRETAKQQTTATAICQGCSSIAAWLQCPAQSEMGIAQPAELCGDSSTGCVWAQTWKLHRDAVGCSFKSTAHMRSLGPSWSATKSTPTWPMISAGRSRKNGLRLNGQVPCDVCSHSKDGLQGF